MNNVILNSETINAIGQFAEILDSFTEAQINEIPFEGSWTPGQVAEHIILSNSGFSDLLAGPFTDTNRQPDLNVENLRSAFLNFDIKMQSPDFILPRAVMYNKADLLSKLDEVKAKLNQIIPVTDLDKTYTGLKLPTLGYLTGIEVVNFIIVHTKRHTHQLEVINRKIHQSAKTTQK